MRCISKKYTRDIDDIDDIDDSVMPKDVKCASKIYVKGWMRIKIAVRTFLLTPGDVDVQPDAALDHAWNRFDRLVNSCRRALPR